MDNLKKINDRLGYFQLNLSHQFNNKPYNGLSTVFSTICIRVCPIFHLSWEKDGIYLIIVCVSFLAGMQNSYERLFQNVEAFFWESVMNQKFYPIPPSPLCVKTKQNFQKKGRQKRQKSNIWRVNVLGSTHSLVEIYNREGSGHLIWGNLWRNCLSN